MQSQEGAQYSRNTAHVKKLLQHNETQRNRKPIQQQSVSQEPNVAETKVQAEIQTAAKPEISLRRSQRQSLAPNYLKNYYT